MKVTSKVSASRRGAQNKVDFLLNRKMNSLKFQVF